MTLRALMCLCFMVSVAIPAVASAFCFNYAGARYGVSPDLLRAVAHVESNFKANAVGDNGNGNRDYGLMQINSASWSKVFGKHWTSVKSDPCNNVIAGAWILSKCLDRHGNAWRSLGCYNTGGVKGRTAKAYVKKVQHAYKMMRRVKR